MKIRLLSCCVAILVILIRMTARVRFHNDPRPELKQRGQNYLFSFLHAHPFALITCREKGIGAMVSRSNDGELVVVTLKVLGMIPIRGSSRIATGRRGDRGGREAIQTLQGHVQDGHPIAISVDGPRGPRGRVHKGIAMLSQQTGAPVLNLVSIASRKLTFASTWDRMQIPLPFSTINCYFSKPIYPVEGEKLESYRRRIEADLIALETEFDPTEARFNVKPMLGAISYREDDEDGDFDDEERAVGHLTDISSHRLPPRYEAA